MTAWCLPIPLTLFVCLLTLTTSASAECAWVMWTFVGASDTNPKVIAGFKNLETCQVNAGQANEVLKAANPRNTGSYVCLPDTVDPRGSKGK